MVPVPILKPQNPPTPVDLAGNDTSANLRSSGTITITMTGIVGDPGDVGITGCRLELTFDAAAGER